jgi:hypothetical protein
MEASFSTVEDRNLREYSGGRHCCVLILTWKMYGAGASGYEEAKLSLMRPKRKYNYKQIPRR